MTDGGRCGRAFAITGVPVTNSSTHVEPRVGVAHVGQVIGAFDLREPSIRDRRGDLRPLDEKDNVAGAVDDQRRHRDVREQTR